MKIADEMLVIGSTVIDDVQQHQVSLEPLSCTCEQFAALNTQPAEGTEASEQLAIDCEHTLAKRLSDAAS